MSDEDSEEEYEREFVEADLDEVDDLEDIDELMAEAEGNFYPIHNLLIYKLGEGDEVPHKRERMVEIEYEVDQEEQQTH